MNRSDQRGSALIVSLVILIVMTVLGLTAMSGSGLQEKMAGNNRDMALAFQAAEAALRDGEAYYENTVVSLGPSAFNGANPGLYAQGSNPDIFSDATWENARTYSGAINGVASQPRYIIELIEELNDKLTIEGYGESSDASSDLGRMTTVVRVTARGVGGAEDTVVYLQSNYKKLHK